MKPCYYRLTNIEIKMDRERYGVLAHVASRVELLNIAVRSYIVDRIHARFDYEPIAQPLDDLELAYQAYSPDLTDALCMVSNTDIALLDIKIEHPTTFIVAVSMPDMYNPLTNNLEYTDNELRMDLQIALDDYLPIEVHAVDLA